MENLLVETIQKLEDCGKQPSDVKWVGMSDGTKACTWEEFVKIADFYYDNGYKGDPCIDLSFVIVGDNWWLERYEYDGSEWWEYKELPKLKDTHEKLTLKDIAPDPSNCNCE